MVFFVPVLQRFGSNAAHGTRPVFETAYLAGAIMMEFRRAA